MEDENYFILSPVANMCQLMDFQMNMSQLSNDDLMKHLIRSRQRIKRTNIY